jgi:myo-inositol-hexaphosphate 3-phosphohydrolase
MSHEHLNLTEQEEAMESDMDAVTSYLGGKGLEYVLMVRQPGANTVLTYSNREPGAYPALLYHRSLVDSMGEDLNIEVTDDDPG